MGNSQTQSSVYSDAAELGKVYTSIWLVIAFIIAVILFISGIYRLYHTSNHIDQISATIKNISCNNSVNYADPNKNYNQNNSRDCYVTLQYNYKEKDYTIPNFPYTYRFQSENNPNTLIGSNIIVYVNPSNPTDISEDSKRSERNTAFFIIGAGVVVLLIAAFNWWLTRRSKFFAAFEGVGAGISVFRNRY
jgi:hypothetical protein